MMVISPFRFASCYGNEPPKGAVQVSVGVRLHGVECVANWCHGI